MSSPSHPLTTAFSVPAALRGGRDAFGLPAIMICFSLVGIGGLVRDIGYPMLAGMLSSALVWAGPAQVLLFGSIATGASLPVVAIAILFSSLRFMPMTISIIPLINDPRRPMWQLMLAAHLIAITNWVEGIRRLPAVPLEERYSYFCGFGLVVMLSGTLATGAGYYLVGALSTPLAAVLLFTTPMFFTVNIVAPFRTWIDWLPVVLAVILVPVATLVVGRDYDLVVAGLLGGTIAYGISRYHRRKFA
ncbi:MAG: AzlC family ABC transporter permease [Beijerinckiaceae bacterium]